MNEMRDAMHCLRVVYLSLPWSKQPDCADWRALNGDGCPR